MLLTTSRFAGFVFIHQLQRARILGGTVDAWLNDLFETYTYFRTIEKLAWLSEKIQQVTAQLKFYQLQNQVSLLKENKDNFSLEEIKAELLNLYELMEEIEQLTGIKTEIPEDDEILAYIEKELYDNAG